MKLLGEFSVRVVLSLLFLAIFAPTSLSPSGIAIILLISIAFMAKERMK